LASLTDDQIAAMVNVAGLYLPAFEFLNEEKSKALDGVMDWLLNKELNKDELTFAALN
jgi:hypothetical protein